MVRTPTKGGAYAAAISAFVIWGLFPIYLIGLLSVPAMELTAHRIVWSLVVVIVWLAALRQLNTVWAAFTNRAALLRLSASAFSSPSTGSASRGP